MSSRPRLGVVILVSVLAFPTWGVTAQGFTAEERERLDALHAVRRPSRMQRNGRTLIGGTAWRVVPRPVDEVWRAANDLGALCRMLPRCTGSRVVARNDDRSTMRFTHEYGPLTASYHVRLEFDQEAHELRFRMDRSRPSDVDDVWGALHVEPYRGRRDRTIVSWGVMADPGSVVAGILGGSLQRSLLRVPDEIYDFLVGPARDRYR